MESLIKREIDQELIIAIVEAEFNTAVSTQDITPLTAGWFNTAYAIHLPTEKSDVVLRITPPPNIRVLTYEKGLMRREVNLHLRLQKSGIIPIPQIRAYNFAQNIIPQDYMFVAKLEGTPLDQIYKQLNDKAKAQIITQLGTICASINQIAGEQFGYAGTTLAANDWPTAYTKMVFALLADGEDLAVKLPVPIDEIRTLYQEAIPLLPDIERPYLSHFDLWLPNIFVIKENGRWQIEAIIDWERAFWGDPQADTVIANNPFGDVFWQGYGRKPESSPAQQKRFALYRLYLWLIMLIEAKIRFADADHLPWTRDQFIHDWRFLTNAKIK